MKKHKITAIIGVNWGEIMIKAVLFDLDGTLINSLDDLADAVNYSLSIQNLPTHETEKYKYFVGDGMRKLIERALPEDMRDSETIDKTLSVFLTYYKAHSLDKTAPYCGIPELLNALKCRGIITAVITNKADAVAKSIVKHFFGEGLSAYGQREGVPTKPDPTLTRIAMKDLGVEPSECLFVGDSGMDMAVAVNSGAVPVGVIWGFRTAEELRQNGAKYLIDTPAALLKLLEK